jgi:hypothetical protein
VVAKELKEQPHIRKLKKRFDAAYTNSQVVRGVWNELERFIVPYRGRMFQQETSEGSVEWDKYDHWDDTAVIAAQTLSASMHGAILPNLQWFEFTFDDDDIQDVDANSNWLSRCSRHCYDAIKDSNFSLEADELFIDLTGFGHGFMISETAGMDEDDLNFNMIPIKEVFFEEDWEGLPHYFFRRLQWSAVKIVSKFGYDNVPERIQKVYDNAEALDTRFVVVFAIFPRDDAQDADTSKPLTPTARPWGYTYFLHECESELGDEGGYFEMPVYSVRWRKVSGSQWGHGPGHVCLGDIRQLNQHRLMRTRAIEKAIDPANVTTERGLMSNLDLGPRGLTVLRDIDALKPYESRANFQISAEELMLLQKSIKQAFRTDQLELKESPAMTATEVQVRYELMQRLLGPTLGRLKVDWLDRVVQTVFNIEWRAGRLPEKPATLKGLDPKINIEYVGAMATAQKAQQAADIIQWAGEMAQLSEPYPDLKYQVNDQELGTLVARLRNIPEKLINGKDEVKRQKQEDADKMAAQQKIAQQQAAGSAMEAQGKGQQAMAEAENTVQ